MIKLPRAKVSKYNTTETTYNKIIKETVFNGIADKIEDLLNDIEFYGQTKKLNYHTVRLFLELLHEYVIDDETSQLYDVINKIIDDSEPEPISGEEIERAFIESEREGLI